MDHIEIEDWRVCVESDVKILEHLNKKLTWDICWMCFFANKEKLGEFI